MQETACSVEDGGSVPGLGGSPGEDLLPVAEMATRSSILAWSIPWAEEPCGLQFLKVQEWDMT